jgi:hypothetical protein
MKGLSVGSEVLRAVIMKSTITWNVVPSGTFWKYNGDGHQTMPFHIPRNSTQFHHTIFNDVMENDEIIKLDLALQTKKLCLSTAQPRLLQ